MATPDRDTVYTNDGTNRTVYTRESSGTGWFVGIIVALALLAIGYLVFSANSGPSTTVDVNGAPATTTEAPADPAIAPAPMTEAPAATTDAAPMTEAPATSTAPAADTAAPATDAAPAAGSTTDSATPAPAAPATGG